MLEARVCGSDVTYYLIYTLLCNVLREFTNLICGLNLILSKIIIKENNCFHKSLYIDI